MSADLCWTDAIHEPVRDEDIDCLTCNDSGEAPMGTSTGPLLMPFCPDCGREPADRKCPL